MTKPSVTALWDGVKSWSAERLPEMLETLNPGVSEVIFDAVNDEVRQKTGHNLPEEVKALYLENDGQKHGSVSGVWMGLEFLSLENVLTQWRGWQEFALDDAWADLSENSTSYPPNAIQPVYAHVGWVPLAYDWGGNHFGVDLAPGPAGRIGQIINFGRDENNKYVMASSLEAFLEWQLAQLQSGNFLIQTETSGDGPERHLVLRTPPNAHLLDVVPKLFGPERRGFLWWPGK